MIGRWLRSRSFADKVTWLMTLTSGVAICGVSFTLATFDYANLRRDIIAGLESQTMIVSMNSSAPLAFNDPVNAAEVLSAFQTRTAVTEATLYDKDGAAFARYRRPGLAAGDSARSSTDDSRKVQRTPIQDRGQRLGTLEVVYEFTELQEHLARAFALSALVSLVAVLLVYVFSLRIRGLLIKPVELLSETARSISQTRDYSQRARKVSNDELGVFTETFNSMLEQIQKQDLEIQASRAEALHASQLKDEFLATLSHELRTPMTPILGWAQILRHAAAGSARVLQAADVIERNARAQNRIVDDLLDMSRIVSGKIILDLTRIDLAGVVAAARDVVAPAAKAKDIALLADVPPGFAMISGDPHRLQQVIWNLLSNAIKFTGPKGQVRVSLRCDSTIATLEISDTGQGIAREFLPHVFERFRQADSSITRHQGGLGLGLAIVRQLVELHGGTVTASSPGLNLGATFTVALPLAPAAEHAPDAPIEQTGTRADAGSTPLNGCKVLLVEDEADTRELVEGVLTIAGANVLSVTSAAEAMAAIVAFEPDVLVSDIGMRDASGYDLIRGVRALAAPACEVPAIALTAFARPEDRTHALAAGFHEHLTKPLDNEALIAAVFALSSCSLVPSAKGTETIA